MVDFPRQFWPNMDNQAVGSFPQPIPPPTTEPDDNELIYVAYNVGWQKVLLAAVDQLALYSTWSGDHDAKILAVNRAIYLKWLLTVPVETGDTEYPTPYWDEDTTADDEMPVETQDWYGMVTNPSAAANELTFVENAVIWILSGFVALVLSPALPVGVAAALTFRTLATRFTLAFNRGDIAEQFRVIIDAQDYGEVDTSDLAVGEVVELTVDGLADLSFHDILIVVSEV